MNKRFFIQPSFCIGLCISLLVLPIPWVFAWFAAALIHELGHLLALKLLHIQVLRIILGMNGAYIETGYITPKAELISALAGPLCGLLCLLASSIAPFLAVCGFVQSIYNLLPFWDFDGGRVLKNILRFLITPQRAEQLYKWIVILASVSLLFFGGLLWLRFQLGPVIFIICVLTVLKNGIRKIPCKQR